MKLGFSNKDQPVSADVCVEYIDISIVRSRSRPSF